MKPTILTNTTLKKPEILIDCYGVAFDNYISVIKKKERLETLLSSIRDEKTAMQTQTRIQHYGFQLSNISEHLRDLDGQIHNYIKTHQH